MLIRKPFVDKTISQIYMYKNKIFTDKKTVV